jgi:MFS transporter, ACS family, D-galactonate transporter
MPWRSYHTVWALLVFGWIGNYVVRMAFAPLLDPVMSEFGLSHAGGGFLFSIFFYGYMTMQIPAGFLGDRFGRKRVLVIGILLVAAATLLNGLAPTLFVLALARLLSGLAQGMYFANDRPIIAAATPADRLAFGQGLSFSGLGLGNALGLMIGGVLGEVLPWRTVFLVLAALPVLSAILIARFVPDPTAAGARPEPDAADGGAASVFRSRDLWLLGLIGMCPVWTQFLIGTWGPAMFMELGVQELSRSALYASLLGVAAPPGLLTMGWLSDALRRRGIARKAVLALALLALAAVITAMGLVVQLRGPASAMAVLVFVGAFFLWGAWAPVYASVAELFPQRRMGLAYGVVNAVSFVSAVFTPYVNGWIRDLTGSFAWGCYGASLIALAGVPLALALRPAFRVVTPR